MIDWTKSWDGFRGRVGEVVIFWIYNSPDLKGWYRLQTMLPGIQKMADCSSVEQSMETAEERLKQWFKLTGTQPKG